MDFESTFSTMASMIMRWAWAREKSPARVAWRSRAKARAWVAVEGLLPGFKRNAARVGVEALGHVHLNAAELVHDVLQFLEVHLHVVGDGDAGEGGRAFSRPRRGRPKA